MVLSNGQPANRRRMNGYVDSVRVFGRWAKVATRQKWHLNFCCRNAQIVLCDYNMTHHIQYYKGSMISK